VHGAKAEEYVIGIRARAENFMVVVVVVVAVQYVLVVCNCRKKNQ